MKTLVIANQKGGVGKSTLTCLVAWFLAQRKNSRTAVIDLDSQGHSSRTLTANACPVRSSHLFESAAVHAPSEFNKLVLYPADKAVATVEQRADIRTAAGQAELRRCRDTFRANLHGLREDYDYCVIDTPPGPGIRMISALAAADYVVAPIELEDYSLAAMHETLQYIFGVAQKHGNPGLSVLGILCNRFTFNSTRQKELLQELRASEKYKQYLIPAHLSTRAAIAKSTADRIPVWELPQSSARDASAEVLKVCGYLHERMNPEHTVAEVSRG